MRVCEACTAEIPGSQITCPSCGALSLPSQSPESPQVILAGLQAALGARYRVERLLGEGGMALVYLAQDLKHGRSVAIKVLRPSIAAFLGPERFLREIRIAAHLDHPGVVGLHDSGEAGGYLYYVMPYLDGESLRDRIERSGPLPISEVLRITREVADALAVAHEDGIVHRDIKPGNILMGRHGRAAVSDFGIARAVAAIPGLKGSITTSTVALLGTPAYMSPEQWLGEHAITSSCDIYALGCVVFEMLTGHPPYSGDKEALMRQHLSGPIPSARALRKEVPLAMDLAIRQALAKKPEDRFLTAERFADALGAGSLDLRSVLRAVGRTARSRAGGITIGATVIVAAALLLVQVIGPGGSHAVRPPGQLRVAIPYFTAADTSLRAPADRITEELTDRLQRIPDLTVYSAQALLPHRGLPAEQLRELFPTDRLVLGTLVPSEAGFRISTSIVEAGTLRQLGSAVVTVPWTALSAEAIAERLSGSIRRQFASYLDSVTRRARVADDSAWVLEEAARAEVRVAERAVTANLDAAGFDALDRADSLLVAARRREHDNRWLAVLQAQNQDRRAFFVEFLRQIGPASATLPDPLPLRASALRVLDSLLRDDPDHVEALVRRGTVRSSVVRVGGPAELLAGAIADLERATLLDRRRTVAWAELAFAYSQAGRFADALFAYDRAMESDPFQSHRETYLRGVFDAATRGRQFSQAEVACREGLSEFPLDDRFRGCDLELLSRTAGSAAAASRALALADSLEGAEENATSKVLRRLYAAGALARSGQGVEADRQAARAEAMLPSALLSPVVLLEMAYVRLQRNDLDSALALARRATRSDPTTPQTILTVPWFEPLRDAMQAAGRSTASP